MKLSKFRWIAVLLMTFAASLPLFGLDRVPVFRLSAGDAVEIHFFYNSELNQSVLVRPDGAVSMPLIGEVVLAGKSPAEAAAELERRYGPILKQPAVTVQVTQFNSQKVYVGGEVNRPGMLPLAAGQTVLAALLESGGQKLTGADHVVLIRRGAGGVPTTQAVSLRARKGAVSEAALVMLEPFDMVLLPESRIARVDRWVDQYIKQVIPGSLSGGFSYLVNGIPY